MYKMTVTFLLGVFASVFVGCVDNSAALDAAKASQPIIPSADEACKKPSNTALPTRC